MKFHEISRLLLFLLLMLAICSRVHAIEVCQVSESAWTERIGSAAVGSSLTAMVSGEIVTFVLSSSGWAAVAVTPAVPTLLAATAFTASGLYIALKGFCARDAVTLKATDIIEVAVNNKPKEEEEEISDYSCAIAERLGRPACPEADTF